MKKSICVLLILTGFSAFAICPLQRSGATSSQASKARHAKPAQKAISPLADLLLASF